MNDPKIALALSGGAARGYAHVGVLKAFEEAKIPIHLITGTSAGAFVGGAFAAGLSPCEISEIGRKLRWRDVASFAYSPRGLLTNSPMADVIKREFPTTNFSDLKIPFAAVVCDLSTGEEVILSEGDLITAIRASCAIPGIFVPVEFEGKKLIDGGVVAPLPTAAARKLGADLVIAVDVIACGADYLGQPSTLIGTFIQSGMLMLRQSSRQQHNYADLVIQPPVSNFRPDEISRGEEMLEIGYKAGLDAIDSIQESIHRLAEEKQARQ